MPTSRIEHWIRRKLVQFTSELSLNQLRNLTIYDIYKRACIDVGKEVKLRLTLDLEGDENEAPQPRLDSRRRSNPRSTV